MLLSRFHCVNCVPIHSVSSVVGNPEAEIVKRLEICRGSFFHPVKSKSLEKHDSLKIFILSFSMFHQAL